MHVTIVKAIEYLTFIFVINSFSVSAFKQLLTLGGVGHER